MADRIIHIAGTPVRLGPLCRQLCAWCGAKLDDKDLRYTHNFGPEVRMPPIGFAHYEVGAYVRVTVIDGRVRGSSVVGKFDVHELPPQGFCGESDVAAVLASEAVGSG